MAYVRRLISEHREQGTIIRRYEVETPKWLMDCYLSVTFPKLVELELRIAQDCADYFSKVPYSLAETIWVQGLRPACNIPFCCGCEYDVHFYPREPSVRTSTELAPDHTEPVIFTVNLSPG